MLFADRGFSATTTAEVAAQAGVTIGALFHHFKGKVDLFGAERAVATGLAFTRYDEVAKALGCHGEYVETTAGLAPAFERAFAAAERDQVPAVVNVKIATSEFRKGAISV